MPFEGTPPRILLAKIGLDGHDRGVKVLARAFRDAGMDVIYTGLWQTCEATMLAAFQEDVDVVGVSLLSATHMTIIPEILRIRRELRIEDIPVVLGGIVPESDHAPLKAMGVAAIFNPGSSLESIMDAIRALVRSRQRPDSSTLVESFKKGDIRALARVLTVVQRGGAVPGLSFSGRSGRVVGVTGAPGVGKSSIIARLGRILRERGRRVAVVAVDPTSPVTGGALLGDRLRMMDKTADSGFFVRSISSGQRSDGLGPHCGEMVAALEGFGFDVVLVETVGAGQSDVGIRDVADRTLLVLMPNAGDSVQFSKAGIVEIASAFVINKCDLPGAEETHAQLLGSIGDDRPVFRASSITSEGIGHVAEWILS